MNWRRPDARAVPNLRKSLQCWITYIRGRKEVTCDTCGQFQISDSGEAAIKRLSPEDRRAKLEEARQLAGPREIPYLGADLFR